MHFGVFCLGLDDFEIMLPHALVCCLLPFCLYLLELPSWFGVVSDVFNRKRVPLSGQSRKVMSFTSRTSFCLGLQQLTTKSVGSFFKAFVITMFLSFVWTL